MTKLLVSERQENNWRRFYNCMAYMRVVNNEDKVKAAIFTNLSEKRDTPTGIAKKINRKGDCKKTRDDIKKLEDEKVIRRIGDIKSNSEDEYEIVENLAKKDEFLIDLLKKLRRRESELGSSEDQLKFFLGDDDEFMTDTYFQMFWAVRLLNVNRKQRETDKKEEIFKKYGDLDIPKIVHQFWKWWVDLASESPPSKSKNMDGMKNQLINDQKIPNPIKIHILSRYIMRRNYSMGSVVGNNEAIKDNQIALQYAEKFLKKQKRAISTKSVNFRENDFYSQQGIEVLLNIERALFKVRSEKDIDEIIAITSNTLGVVLMERNRIWRSICLFWCYQILWRCFICKGENDIAETFKRNALATTDSLAEKRDIVLSGSYADWGKAYDDTNASNHLKNIKKQLAKPVGKIEKYYSKIPELVESRRIFYEDFIGIDKEATRWNHQGGGVKKRPRNLLTHVDKNTKKVNLHGPLPKGEKTRKKMYVKVSTDNWEGRVRKIPETMKSAISKLEDEGTIVSIPAIKLVIVDLLFYISRLATGMNPEERNNVEEGIYSKKELKYQAFRNKIINKNDKKIIEDTWSMLRKSLTDIEGTIQSTKNRIELSLGEESVRDLTLIIKKLQQLISTKEDVIYYFLMEGNNETVPVSTSKKAGEEIQTLLKYLKTEELLKISFPVKMKPQN